MILIFDIPSELRTLKRQVDRKLAKIRAEMIQKSVWRLNDVKALIDIASWIKASGGDARILEEKFIF